MASNTYHETDLPESVQDMHRAISSLMEELEAVDWYNQRAESTNNEDLKEILEHNRDEEKEHVAMLLNWICNKDECFSRQLKRYLFTDNTKEEIDG